AHRSLLPELAGLEGGPITTVAPSTTASALTSLATGLAPSQHGLVGFRMRVGDDVLNILRWQTAGNHRPPDPFEMQRHTAFLGRPVPVVTRSEFRHSGFTEAQLRGARFVGWNAVSTLVEHCRRLAGAGERFVYGYYPGVDAPRALPASGRCGGALRLRVLPWWRRRRPRVRPARLVLRGRAAGGRPPRRRAARRAPGGDGAARDVGSRSGPHRLGRLGRA